MLQKEFDNYIKALSLLSGLPQVLAELKQSDNQDVAEAAKALTGQFAVAEVEGEKRIYHVTVQLNDSGDKEEFVEHVMNEGDDVIVFIAWFFSSFFDTKPKQIYQAVGKTYKQPKKSAL
jgi:lantibiotic modifying enzyme